MMFHINYLACKRRVLVAMPNNVILLLLVISQLQFKSCSLALSVSGCHPCRPVSDDRFMLDFLGGWGST